MKPGTIVMLRAPLPLTFKDHSIVNGAVGEVVGSTDEVGKVLADFPQYPCWSDNKLWVSPVAWLIPLSDPDADIGVDETLKRPVEDLV